MFSWKQVLLLSGITRRDNISFNARGVNCCCESLSATSGQICDSMIKPLNYKLMAC